MYGVPLSIILDRGTKFTSHFWKVFQSGLGTKVKLSTSFSAQMNGLAKQTIKTLEDMFRACFIDFKGNWDDPLPLIKFSYNIFITQVLSWLNLRLFMGEDVDLRLGGLR